MFKFDSEKVSVGDKVIVIPGGWNRSMHVAIVERKTPSGLVIVDGTTYNKNGLERARYGKARIVFHTQELEDKINEENRRNDALRKIRDVKWDNVSTDVICNILAVIKDDKQCMND